MNCKICAKKFRRLKDVIRHGAEERHSHFFCTSCALSLTNVLDVEEHSESKEHCIMALATGVRFDTKDTSDFISASFPPHNCCLLCGSRDGTLNNTHLKTDNHRYMAWLLRTMITSKKLYCSNSQASSSTQAFISKIINAKRKIHIYDDRSSRASQFVCELCNLHFVSLKYLDEHLADQSHKRMEKFVIKIYDMVKGIDIIGARFDKIYTKAFSNSLRPLYYCEVCCMWIDTHCNYNHHRKSSKHKNAEMRFKKSRKRKKGDSMVSCFDAGVVEHHSKLKVSKYERYSGEELITSKHCLKIENVVSECCDECSEELKVPTSHENRHYFSVKEEHHKKIIKVVNKGNLSGQDHGTFCYGPSLPDIEVGEIKSHAFEASRSDSSSLQLGASETTKNTLQLGLKDGEIVSDSPRLEDGEADVGFGEEHYCELCDFLCYSSLHYEKHLTGEQHKRMRRLINRKVKKADSDAREECETSSKPHSQQFNCELCDVFNHSSQEYEFHLSSAVHKKNKWLLFVLKEKPVSIKMMRRY